MANSKLPSKSEVTDKQFVQVAGPDGVVSGFQYDKETNSFYIKDKQIIIPSFHGQTHVGQDPIPNATVDTPGLESADDKAKLDSLLQTEIGVLGFMGAGFPDDGGFMKGRIILAAGTEFISLEKIGNVVRFTVDSPIPFNCGIEECAQIFWIQDETDTASIRPPSCAGKLPGVNAYGELKIYLMPESTIINSSNPAQTLNAKGNYPALVFKRYDNSIAAGLGSFEVVLERNPDLTTKTGWAMTPGPTGKVECVWFTGFDADGNPTRFDLDRNPDPGLLGALLYNGHTLTRQKAVITGYTQTILSTNIYTCKFWNVDGAATVGDDFTARNVWRYSNPENATTDVAAPKTLLTDATADLLPIGTLVDIWEFRIQETTDVDSPIVRRYFTKQPEPNPTNLWALSGSVRFGERATLRSDVIPGTGPTDLQGALPGVIATRLFENAQWGITGFEDPLYLADDSESTTVVDYAGDVLSIGSQNPLLPEPNVELTISSSPFTVNTFTGKSVLFTILTGLGGRTFKVLQNSADSITVGGIGPTEFETAVSEAGALPTPLNIFSESAVVAPSGVPINNRFVANVDYDRPGLVISQLPPLEDREQPVFLWHRGTHNSVYVKALVGQPANSLFPPIDIMLRAPIDSLDTTYMQVVARGTISAGVWAGRDFIRVTGVDFYRLPSSGTIRTLTGIYRDRVWSYTYKIPFGVPSSGTSIMLVGDVDVPFLFDEDFHPGDSNMDPSAVSDTLTPENTTVVEVLHQDFSGPCVRIEFSVNDNASAEAIQLQFKAGILDMSEPYELDVDLPEDNYVRGLRPGEYTVSRIYTQDGFIVSGAETPEVEPSGFKVNYGGFTVPSDTDSGELWNILEILYKNDQIWIWWNGLLVPPDTDASAALPTPSAVNTPYFPVTSEHTTGKVGFRLWPGAVIRDVEVRDNLIGYSEFTHGQLEVSSGG
jgi:hypothetical protein